MNNKIISLLIVVIFLTNLPVYAKEIHLNSTLSIPATVINSKNFRIERNIEVDKKLIISKGTIGTIDGTEGKVMDVYGNPHVFTLGMTKETARKLTKRGYKIIPIIGVTAATVAAIPAASLLMFINCSSVSSPNCGAIGIVPFVPAAILATKAFKNRNKEPKEIEILAIHQSPKILDIP